MSGLECGGKLSDACRVQVLGLRSKRDPAELDALWRALDDQSRVKFTSDVFSFLEKKSQRTSLLRRGSGSKDGPFPLLRREECAIDMDIVTNWVQSDWESFHSRKALFGVLRIATWGDDGNSVDEIRDMAVTIGSSYASVPVRLVLVFIDRDPTPELYEVSKSHEEIALIRGGIDDAAAVVGSSIVRYLERWMTDVEVDGADVIVSPLDSHADSDDLSKLRKKRPGRMIKIKGDRALLAGTPRDARALFVAAADAAKSNADWVWYAGALEGHSSALSRMIDLGMEGVQLSEVVEKAEDAADAYGRANARHLQVETLFKLARLHIHHDDRCESARVLGKIHMLGQELGVQDRIRVASEIASLCQEIGFHRKLAFYLRHLSGLYRDIFQQTAAHRLTLLASRYYGLDSLVEHVAVMEGAKSVSGNKKLSQWKQLQKLIVSELLQYANELNEPRRAALYVSYMLSELHDSLTDKEQMNAANTLRMSTATILTERFPWTPALPLVRYATPRPMEGGLAPTGGNQAPADQTSSIFLYCAFEKRQKTAVRFSRGERAVVEVIVENPFAFVVPVEAMWIETLPILAEDDNDQPTAALESHPVSFSLPPKTKNYRVPLHVTPCSVGKARIGRVVLQAFNLVNHFDVSAERDESDMIDVCEELPVLVASSMHRGGLSVFPGTKMDIPITLTNSTATDAAQVRLALEVTDLQIGTSSDATVQLRSTMDDWVSVSGDRELALPAGKSASVTLSLCVPSDARRNVAANQTLRRIALLRVSYARSSGGPSRSAAESVSISVLPGLRVTRATCVRVENTHAVFAVDVTSNAAVPLLVKSAREWGDPSNKGDGGSDDAIECAPSGAIRVLCSIPLQETPTKSSVADALELAWISQSPLCSGILSVPAEAVEAADVKRSQVHSVRLGIDFDSYASNGSLAFVAEFAIDNVGRAAVQPVLHWRERGGIIVLGVSPVCLDEIAPNERARVRVSYIPSGGAHCGLHVTCRDQSTGELLCLARDVAAPAVQPNDAAERGSG